MHPAAGADRASRNPPSCQLDHAHADHATAAEARGGGRRHHGGVSAAAAAGAWPVEAIGKHELMRRTGLPARDLRVLDPALPCPRPASWAGTAPSSSTWSAPAPSSPRPRFSSPGPGTPPSRRSSSSSARASPPAPPHEDAGGASLSPPGGGKVQLPFEFRALEVCLEFACKSLEHEGSMLEKEAYPALDALTSKVSTLNLEHVRKIKSRLVAISVGAHKVRDELEHLLDDDADMAAMHLSEKLAYQAAGQSSRLSDIEKEPGELDEEREDDQAEQEDDDNGDEGSTAFTPRIDELENLLEAYFVQIDGTLNKLSTLREYVEDTEDHINIMLDDKQNQLQMGVVLSTATLTITCAIVATAVFGINIHIALYRITDTAVFWEAAGGMLAGAAMLYYRKSGILR